MRVRVGSSGYSYKQWKGPFYPADLKDADMLRYYAERLSTVEINNTFYRMPAASVLTRWAEEVPAGFTFVLKAPRRITHERRLKDAGDDVAYFLKTAAVLGPRLGPILFQTPPFLKKDAERLRQFLTLLPPECRAAFEFRHESWFDDEIREALRARGAALCLADTEEGVEPQAPVATTAWGYLRLRRPSYSPADLAAWAEKMRSQPWTETFVFFKHEDEGRAPELAAGFLAACRTAGLEG